MYSFTRFMLAATLVFSTVAGIALGLGETALFIYFLVSGQWLAAVLLLFIGSMILFFIADLAVRLVTGIVIGVAQMLSPRALADFVALHP